MADSDVALMAHLMRRAGFGAPIDELEARAANGYANTVEELLNPEKQPEVDIYELHRYHPWTWKPGTLFGMGHASWTYRLLNTEAPLQEKMALFWHCIFATGVSKVDTGTRSSTWSTCSARRAWARSGTSSRRSPRTRR